MYVVGLTGGIGSGKTAVSDLFETLHVPVIDADVCARVVVEKGRPALEKIRQYFGDDILTETGELNRPALRKIIFSDLAKKDWLEKLLHPLIGEEIFSQLLKSVSPYRILASPLLLETGQKHLCQRILVVDTSEELQVQRTTQRDNNNAEEVRAIMNSQMPRNERLASADDVIENTTGLDHLSREVKRLNEQYLTLAAQHGNSSHAV